MPRCVAPPGVPRLPYADRDPGGLRHCAGSADRHRRAVRRGAAVAGAAAGPGAAWLLPAAAAAGRSLRPSRDAVLCRVADRCRLRDARRDAVPQQRGARSRAAGAAAGGDRDRCRARSAGARLRQRAGPQRRAVVHRRYGGGAGRFPPRRRRDDAAGSAGRPAAPPGLAPRPRQSASSRRRDNGHRRLARSRARRADRGRFGSWRSRRRAERKPAAARAVFLLHRYPIGPDRRLRQAACRRCRA